MVFKLCPKCELNYIREEDACCAVCARINTNDEIEDNEGICIECGINPALPSGDLCMSCLSERLPDALTDGDDKVSEDEEEEETLIEDIDDVDNMDEEKDEFGEELEIEDAPEEELELMEKELSQEAP